VSIDAPHWENRDEEVVINFVNENTEDESEHIKPDVDDIGKLYCVCRKSESGDMILNHINVEDIQARKRS